MFYIGYQKNTTYPISTFHVSRLSMGVRWKPEVAQPPLGSQEWQLGGALSD